MWLRVLRTVLVMPKKLLTLIPGCPKLSVEVVFNERKDDTEMKDETLKGLIAWILKPGKSTSEFVLTFLGIGLGILKGTIWPDLPTEMFYGIVAYIISRSIAKTGLASGIEKILRKFNYRALWL